MAAPTYLTLGTAGNGVGDVTPGLPAGYSVGTVFLLIAETANQALSAPSGWVEVTNSPQGTGTAGDAAATRLTVFWRRAQSLAESAPTLTDAGDHIISRIFGFDGCRSSGDPWDVTSGDVEPSATTTVVIPGLTTTVADCLVLGIASRSTDISTSEFAAATNGSLTSIDNIAEVASTSGNGGGYRIASGIKATAGVVSNWGGGTLTTASAQGRMSIALTATAAASSTTWAQTYRPTNTLLRM